MLAEGDVLFIPEPEEREVDRPTNQRHQFRAHVPTLVVQLRLLGVDGKPRPEEVVAVTIDGAAAQFETVAPGTIQTRIEPTASQVSVQLGEEMLHFGVGFLQPIETLAGQRERLNNLGYFAGDSDDPNVLELRSAVEEFQCDQGLFVDGKVGPQTRAALVKAHGC